MREQLLQGLKSQTGLLPGMLKRSKYSRLRDESLTSLEDLPQRMFTLKREFGLDSDFALLDPRTPAHQRPSSLRDFLPRVANIRLQIPVSPRGQMFTSRDQNTERNTNRPLSRTEWDLVPHQRFCSLPSFGESLLTGQSHSALNCPKRPITLHRMAGLPWKHSCPPCMLHRDGLCCLKTSAADEHTGVLRANRAVHYDIKYLGSVEVTKSMRTLDFETRMQVTREAINRLREHTSNKTALRTKRSGCKGLSAVLGQINLEFSGKRIDLAVSTDSVTLIAASSLQKIAHHPMQAISFASGGDPEMADYIAYVAKDLFNQRACHILECPRGRAGEVINSIGQAFENRFRQLLGHSPSLLSTNARSVVRLCQTTTEQKAQQKGAANQCHDYYNVIPGKTPPAGETELLQLTEEENKNVSLYENCSTTEGTTASLADSAEAEVTAECCTPDLIQDEDWFHGRLGREQAESLLSCSGDFLVRESSSASGQYILSGMEGGTVRHLLLVDARRQARTRDQLFLSIGHLVRFHMGNQMPIVSGSTELCLKQPVHKEAKTHIQRASPAH